VAKGGVAAGCAVVLLEELDVIELVVVPVDVGLVQRGIPDDAGGVDIDMVRSYVESAAVKIMGYHHTYTEVHCTRPLGPCPS
jgi:hypothetical protein